MAWWLCHWAVMQKAWVQLPVRLVFGLRFFSVISNSLTSLPSCKIGTCLNLAGEWTKPTGCANTSSRGV